MGQDDGGISLYELYADFALRSGWLVPTNVSSVPNSDRPEFLRCQLRARVWSHETEWPLLRLQRQSLTDQVCTFRKVGSSLFELQGITWQTFPGKSLRVLGGSLSFASLQWRPVSSLNGKALVFLRGLQSGSQIRTFMSRTFAAPTVPEESHCPRPDVKASFATGGTPLGSPLGVHVRDNTSWIPYRSLS